MTIRHGSSPHTRGARRTTPTERRRYGIIPAYAGSTGRGARRPSRSPDHPRIRGEHSVFTTISSMTSGSSPHTRGAPPTACRRGKTSGIIPAYAGSTKLTIAGLDGKRDHPRIRGEHWSSSLLTRISAGSSPHTRGARRPEVDFAHVAGIIPAYAGSTVGEVDVDGTVEDHPRIRGEHRPP